MLDFKTVKLVIWDLDETLWSGTLSANETIRLDGELVSFIQDSLDRGIVHSICSKNEYEPTKRQLQSFGIWELFVFPSINWRPKGERIKKIIEDMKLRAPNVLFVDDNTSNLGEARYYCPQLQVCTPEELKRDIEALQAIEAVDTARPRLQQYRILEEKAHRQEEFSSNADFLMSCNIRVDFHENCMEEIDRIHELILRSNQLNYTKYRQGKDELAAALASEDTQAAYITVKDAFGEYGIVGFYMFCKGKLVHFLFSCRTLGMLVEQYVYMKINCPNITVVGDVITQLNKTEMPPWINQEKVSDNRQNTKGSTDSKIVLFKGPCDIQQIFSFIQQTPSIKTDFTYINDLGVSIEGHNHTSQILTAMKANAQDKEKILNSLFWADKQMLDSSVWNGNDVVVLSMLTDGNLGVYRHKETGWQIAVCEKCYDLTDPKNWKPYIDKSVFTSNITFDEDALRQFADEYEFVDNSDGGITLDSLNAIYDKLDKRDKRTTLVLVLGSEIPFEGSCKPSYAQRHLFHKVLNDRIREWAKGKDSVRLIEISKYITSQKDYSDTINHFQKKVYYEMAQDLLALVKDDNTDFKMKGKWYMYLSSMKMKAKALVKQKILRR